MLSHHERVELDKIERWFETSDPELAAALRRGKPARSAALLTAFAILLDVAACGLLVAGIAASSPALTVCALFAAAGGVAAHVARCRG
ncbi:MULTISPECIES: DUF3040 domain-containing protein [Amycolatopsis]|uniref:DUF3040 domain-containing protein n=1 Tax=Amycolatopsis TaxID=1813 RepID=UPI0003AABF62|nr:MULTISPECIES: DUF3040 domain-containing protein [Amycolatopsis]MCG3753447.1 DUF3040 domain-containing protein [Amycolatopsis sp. Poz14]